MLLETNPLFEKLKNVNNVLISGSGGGFDVFSGIPYFLALKNMGKNVYLSNHSSTILKVTDEEKVAPHCFKVTPKEYEYMNSYFPEKYLSQWLEKNNLPSDIYAFRKVGPKLLIDQYNYIIDKHNIEAIILIDGGTNSMMFGDEPDIGTPVEDICSIISVGNVNVGIKILSCIGFGLDDYNGVDHYYFLRNVATLTKTHNFLGNITLLPQMEETKLYSNLIEYVNKEMYTTPSIIANSIISATQGEYGDFHATYRTKGNKLWINPLMSLFWNFNLDAVVEKIQYNKGFIGEAERVEEVHRAIKKYRTKIKKEEKKGIPL